MNYLEYQQKNYLQVKTRNKTEKAEQEEKYTPLQKERENKISRSSKYVSILIHIISNFIMVAIPVLRMNPILASAIFLFIIAIATTRIVKHYMSVPKFEKTKKKKRSQSSKNK